MRLFLIRHGETVDNVAGLYAGVRDSALTNHGMLQGKKLGQYFASSGISPTHYFSSNLQRAYQTAKNIRGEIVSDDAAQSGGSVQEVAQRPSLQEQDFGSMEGVPFGKKPYDFKTGKQAEVEGAEEDADYVPMETKESMGKRADEFIDEDLLPLMRSESADSPFTVVVVSHGIMLSVLWRRFLKRLPARSITLQSEITAKGPVLDLEHLGGWSNTGYLDLLLSKRQQKAAPSKKEEAEPTQKEVNASSILSDDEDAVVAQTDALDAIALPVVKERVNDYYERPPEGKDLDGWSTVIQTINGKAHLEGLKRTRGGVGSAQHDDKQKSLDGFFKKQRT